MGSSDTFRKDLGVHPRDISVGQLHRLQHVFEFAARVLRCGADDHLRQRPGSVPVIDEGIAAPPTAHFSPVEEIKVVEPFKKSKAQSFG
jgi:hypothetical protein